MKGNAYVPFMLRRGDGSTLSLDFTAMGGTLDSRFTFTRSTTATFINSSGYVESIGAAGSNDPTKARFDYDPTTLTPRGLLIEASATNRLGFSQDLTQTSVWTIQTAYTSVSATGGTSPQNTNTGNLFTEPNTNQARSIYQAPVGATAGTYTASVWAKAGSGSARFIRLVISSATTNFGYVTVALATGAIQQAAAAVGTASNAVGTVEAYPNGWYRIRLTVTVAASVNFCFIVPLDSTGAGVTPTSDYGRYAYAGNSSTFLLWGAQLETGSSASSYIPTPTSSTVQRAADSCAILLSSFGFSTTAGTLYADWYRKNGDSGSQSGGPWSTDYASARWLGVQNAVASNTVSLSSWSGSTNIANGSTRNKAAATYGAWTGSVSPTTFCVNNSAVTSANRDFNPSTATYLTIGAGSSSAGSSPAYGVATRDWLNNSIRVIKYWPSILPNETLQSLTT